MGDHNEMKKISAAFAASYGRFIKGYQQYKANRSRQQPDGEVDHYDNNRRIEQTQR